MSLILADSPQLLPWLYESLGHARERCGDPEGARSAYARSLWAHEAAARRGIADPGARRDWGDALAESGVDLCGDLVRLVRDEDAPEAHRRTRAKRYLRRGRSFVRTMRRQGLIDGRYESRLLRALSRIGRPWPGR
jgi:hypothetical protein